MYLFVFTAGGFEHVLQLRNLVNLEYGDFWKAFDDLPPSMAQGHLQEKMQFLRDGLENAERPLM